MIKRLLLLLMIGALALGIFACGEPEPDPGSSPLGAYSDHTPKTEEAAPARNYISLIYYEDMDGNPLTTTNRENHELLKLVYSPLIRLNGKLEAEYVLAESITMEGKTVRITLRKGLKFSDGSAVTAEDLDDSIQTIRQNPTSPYHSRLTNIKRYYAENSRTLVINLKEEDVDFINNLDLPIMKGGKGVGCGPYRFSKKGGERVLVANTHYFARPAIQTIYLKEPTDEKERQNMFAVGLLDVYFGTAESAQVFAGGKAYSVQSYPGDNLLYLGINCREGLLKSGKFRSFLNQITAREKLVKSVLLGQGEAARYPYQPSWYKAPQTVPGSGISETERKEQAAALGLSVTENALLNSAGKPLTFRLLVAAESNIHKAAAEAVAEGLAIAGVTIKIEAVPRAEYDARLAEGTFDLYLGEIKTGRTLNPALYASGSAVNFSGVEFTKLQSAAAQYQSGKISLSAFCEVFDRYTPILPLAYRGGALFAAGDIGEFQSTGSWALYGDMTKLVIKSEKIETEKTK